MFYKIKKKHIISILTLVAVVVVSFAFLNNLKQNPKKTSTIHKQEVSETNSKDTQNTQNTQDAQLSDENNNYEDSEIISRHYIYEKDQVPYVILLD
jgi:uncharacterized membrane protein